MDEATARALAIILTALGIPALLVSLGRSLWKWWTGRAARERVANNDLVSKLRRAEAEQENEARDKRQALEYASRLRRQLIERGIEPAPWPHKLGVPQIGPNQRQRERLEQEERDSERRGEILRDEERGRHREDDDPAPGTGTGTGHWG